MYKKRARLSFDETLSSLVTTKDESERKIEASKLGMYTAQLCDLEREIPSDELLGWWTELQTEIHLVFKYILDGKTTGEVDLQKSLDHLMDGIIRKARTIFQPGMKCRLYVLSIQYVEHKKPELKRSFDDLLRYINVDPRTGYTTPKASVVSTIRVLRQLSKTLTSVYDLEPLDLPIFDEIENGNRISSG